MERIDDMMKKEGIESILIADDSKENLDAAKEYFGTLGIKVEYASSAKEAIRMIAESKGRGYDLVLTDLEMEDKFSGLEVAKQAFMHWMYPLIVTGYDGGHHGYFTHIHPLEEAAHDRKDKASTWKEIAEIAVAKMSTPLMRTLKQVKGMVPMEENWELMFRKHYERACGYNKDR